MLHLTPCNLSTLLTLAKEAHTRWEERFRMEGATPPVHTWEGWYAKFIIARLTEQEMGDTFDAGTCGIEQVADNHVTESPFVSEPSEPDQLCSDRYAKRLYNRPAPDEPRDFLQDVMLLIVISLVIAGVVGLFL